MIAMLLLFVMAMLPPPPTQGAQSQAGEIMAFDIRANSSLILGKGEQSGETYYDVTITKDATKGVLVKLPYTTKGGKFTFDLHHRISLTPNFEPAEITTIVEVITGGGTSIGVYNIVAKIGPGNRFDETIAKVSKAEVDRYITPLSRKTITIDTQPGPQTLSIVGKSTILTRGASTTRIDTPGIRIATVSKMRFAEATTGIRLSVE